MSNNLGLSQVGKSILDFLDGFKQELVTEIRTAIALEKSSEQPSSNADQVLTRKEAAELLDCSLATLCHYQKQGTIPFYKAGKKVIFRREELLEAIRKQARKGGRHE